MGNTVGDRVMGGQNTQSMRITTFGGKPFFFNLLNFLLISFAEHLMFFGFLIFIVENFKMCEMFWFFNMKKLGNRQKDREMENHKYICVRLIYFG